MKVADFGLSRQGGEDANQTASDVGPLKVSIPTNVRFNLM